MSINLRNTLSVSLALSMLLAFVPASRSADDVEASIARAADLIQQGKYKPALSILGNVVKTNPNNSKAHVKYGKALAIAADASGQYDQAIAEEEAALKIDPGSFEANVTLGQIYANLRQVDQSIKHLQEACKIKPSSPGAHRDLGIAYLSGGKPEEAITALKKAIELKPDLKDAQMQLGKAYFSAGKFDESLSASRKAVELDGKSEEAHLNLAALLYARGNYRDALAECDDAIKLAPGDANAHLLIGKIMLESGDDGAAAGSFHSAMSCNKQRNPLIQANALSGLGWAIAAKDASAKDLEDGIKDEREAIRIFPHLMPAYTRLADLLCKADKNREAEDIYKTAMQVSKDDAGVCTAYAKFLDKIGRKTDARAALKKVLEKSPQFKPASDALAALDQSRTK